MKDNKWYKCVKLNGNYDYHRGIPSNKNEYVSIEEIPQKNIVYQDKHCILVKQ